MRRFGVVQTWDPRTPAWVPAVEVEVLELLATAAVVCDQETGAVFSVPVPEWVDGEDPRALAGVRLVIGDPKAPPPVQRTTEPVRRIRTSTTTPAPNPAAREVTP